MRLSSRSWLDEVLYCLGCVFDRNCRVDAVLVEEVDDIDAEVLQRVFCYLLDALWSAVHALPSGTAIGIEIETKSCRNDNFALVRRVSFAEESLIGEWTINLGGVEERCRGRRLRGGL